MKKNYHLHILYYVKHAKYANRTHLPHKTENISAVGKMCSPIDC